MMVHFTSQRFARWLRIEPAYPGARIEITVTLMSMVKWIWHRLTVPKNWVCVIVQDNEKPPFTILGITYRDPSEPRPYRYYPYQKDAPK